MQQFVKKVAIQILFASAAATAANAQSDSILCNDKLIKGVYGFTLEGTKLSGNGPTGPQVGIAITEFLPETGTLQQVDSVTIDGIHIARCPAYVREWMAREK